MHSVAPVVTIISELGSKSTLPYFFTSCATASRSCGIPFVPVYPQLLNGFSFNRRLNSSRNLLGGGRLGAPPPNEMMSLRSRASSRSAATLRMGEVWIFSIRDDNLAIKGSFLSCSLNAYTVYCEVTGLISEALPIYTCSASGTAIDPSFA